MDVYPGPVRVAVIMWKTIGHCIAFCCLSVMLSNKKLCNGETETEFSLVLILYVVPQAGELQGSEQEEVVLLGYLVCR